VVVAGVAGIFIVAHSGAAADAESISREDDTTACVLKSRDKKP
jgi:hypothetical protein